MYEHPSLPTHLTGIIDENGDRYATWDYDDAGRAILSVHANGKERVAFDYNPDGTTTLTIGDPDPAMNPSVRTYDYSTQQGSRKVSSLTGDVCSTCPGGNVESRTYDAKGFLEDATDWNGNVTRTERNDRGLTTKFTEAYNSITNDDRITDRDRKWERAGCG